ncbi:NADH-quinone oxidoreductase subunit NuoN [Stygiolobus caldivivus]|uniref:NADH-quinone oxidoreductase subunit N n=1 Tax=Stygiolobus caldivivus TaxID=2824673 RepID=A0A8D5U4J4_9CREN|nr:NADH-quinone oxidoreductase subunit NuoN [Stygiolobus caldivivus]BCU69340.1 NADH-quinone oxidoreductase subunit N [Stygiolobus caldivivus]
MELSIYLPIVIPSVIMVVTSIAVLYVDNGKTEGFLRALYFALASLIVSLILFVVFFTLKYYGYGLFSYSIHLTPFGYFIAIASLLASIIIIIGGINELRDWDNRSSFLSLVILTNLGVLYLAFAYNVLTIFASWGIASAATYVIAMLKKDYNSTEAGVKYLVMGLLSSSLMIVGLAFYVLGINSLSLDATVSYTSLVVVGILFFSVAFLFKIGAFPFQGWLPDVYSMADRVSVAFVSSVGKIVGIAPLVVILYYIQPMSSTLSLTVFVLFVIISIASLVFGNISAFSRKDFAAMLSYSSITQVGFMLIAIAMFPYDETVALAGLMVYLIAYSVAQAGLFLALSHVEKISGTSSFEGFRGIGNGDKALAFAISILLLSLLGLPPILGFWAKLFVLESSFSQPWLTIIGFLNSAIAAGYYIPPIREMFREGSFEAVNSPERSSTIIASILSIILGILAPLIFGVLI